MTLLHTICFDPGNSCSVKKGRFGFRVLAILGDSMYTNPLFDAKIVKAGTVNQTRQYK